MKKFNFGKPFMTLAMLSLALVLGLSGRLNREKGMASLFVEQNPIAKVSIAI